MSAFDKLLIEAEQPKEEERPAEAYTEEDVSYLQLPAEDTTSKQAFGYLKGMQNPCLAFLFTVKLSGIKAYTLCALLDSGADCNLARKEAFSSDCWTPTNTSIHSVTHANNPIRFQAHIPLQFANHTCYVTFLQFPVEQYDCIIGSQTLQEWSPYTIGHQGTYIDFPFGRVTQLNEFRAYAPKLSFPVLPKPIPSSSRVWLTQQSFSAQGDLANIQADFSATVLTKDLTKYQRNMECTLPIKKDENYQTMYPKSKANYFVLSKEEQELCERDIKELLKK